MLPDVGSTIVPPGWSSPEASAASIIRVAIRSFTEPPGLRYSIFPSTIGPSFAHVGIELGGERAGQPQQRGVADEVEERVDVLHHANLVVRVPIRATRAPCSSRLRRVREWGRPEPRASLPLPPPTAAAACRCSVARCTACWTWRRALARRTIGEASDEPTPDSTGWYGRGRPGPAIRVALLGDSSAAGYGVDRVEDTPGARLASGLAERADRRVHLREYAVVGAESSRPEHPDRPDDRHPIPTSR